MTTDRLKMFQKSISSGSGCNGYGQIQWLPSLMPWICQRSPHRVSDSMRHSRTASHVHAGLAAEGTWKLSGLVLGCEHSALGNGIAYWWWWWMLFIGWSARVQKQTRPHLRSTYLRQIKSRYGYTQKNIQIISTCWDDSIRIVFVSECQHKVMFWPFPLLLKTMILSLSVSGCLASVPYQSVYFCCRPAPLPTTETKSSASLCNRQMYSVKR